MIVGEVVEVHLLNGKRFLGKITNKDSEGILVFCVPVKALESVSPSNNALEELRDMLHTLFFAWQQIEYIDIGGEPVGFPALYSSWFHGMPLTEFFDRSILDNKSQTVELFNSHQS